MAKVEIYTKAFCPYCSRALALLRSKGVEIEETDITMDVEKRAEMIARADGRVTVACPGIVYPCGLQGGGSQSQPHPMPACGRPSLQSQAGTAVMHRSR